MLFNDLGEKINVVDNSSLFVSYRKVIYESSVGFSLDIGKLDL